jgi:hypothetical protein
MAKKTSEVKHKITIKVSDYFGQPVKDRLVFIYWLDEEMRRIKVTSCLTDEQGEADFNLQSGSYDLEVRDKEGNICHSRRISLPPQHDLNAALSYQG